MIGDAIWTSAAAQDYLAADSRLVPSQAIDAMIALLRLFPEMGSSVAGSSQIRRVLVGRKRVYGIYYAINELRIIVVGLIDLRQDPSKIEELLGSRGIGG